MFEVIYAAVEDFIVLVEVVDKFLHKHQVISVKGREQGILSISSFDSLSCLGG
jgi:hypothetical protein